MDEKFKGQMDNRLLQCENTGKIKVSNMFPFFNASHEHSLYN